MTCGHLEDGHIFCTGRNFSNVQDVVSIGAQALDDRHIAAFISGEVDRPAPKLIDAIEDLAKQLHPEAFAKPAEPGGAR